MVKRFVSLLLMLIFLVATAGAGELTGYDGGDFVLNYPQGYDLRMAEDGAIFVGRDDPESPLLSFMREDFSDMNEPIDQAFCSYVLGGFHNQLSEMLAPKNVTPVVTRGSMSVDKGIFAGCGMSLKYVVFGREFATDQMFYFKKGGKVLYGISATYLTGAQDWQLFQQSVDSMQVK